MELLMLLGLLAVVALVAIAALYVLNRRRSGTIVAVSIPMRSLPHATRRGEETDSRH
jgi:hypothetical protein